MPTMIAQTWFKPEIEPAVEFVIGPSATPTGLGAEGNDPPVKMPPAEPK